jgi:hypothetical protein
LLTSTNILKVLGNSGDSVNASGFAKISTIETEGSIIYNVYTHSGANTDANAARALLILVKSRVKPLPSSVSVSMLPPPSTRARLPTFVCANAVMLLALMVMVSLPEPALVKPTPMLLI